MMQIQSASNVSTQPVQSVALLGEGVGRQSAGTATVADSAGVARDARSNTLATSADNQESRSPAQDDLDQALQKINDALDTLTNRLEFSIDKDTETMVVKVVDRETKEVIRQLPSEEMLNIAKALDKLQGLLISDQA